ncbi:GAF domain-containing protein [Halobium salinum]|uniref:histidine kinase n=1 Tax=Halobium salinum TaxID=1364940 RepID=A0ABD5PCA5_9EURY|nr:GAF domain-containing protein [Halobium salinum]
MTPATPAPEDVLEKVDALGPPGTPVTTPEVADGFDCTQRTIYNRLDALVDDGILQTKKVGAKSRVWWRPVDGDALRNGGARDRLHPVSLRDGQAPSSTVDSEMAERIREFEWASTPLGPIDEWPPELRVAVDIMLGSDEAIGIYWGTDLILLYNDAAREQIGKKHPDALGRPAREVFPEAWETLASMHEQVMAGEGAVRVEEKYLPLERGETVEDVWFDSSFNPIPVADGSIGGVFNVSVEVTGRVKAEAALQKRKQETQWRYQTVLDSMDEGFFLADVVFDSDGEPLDIFYRDSNPAATEMVGEEFEGRWLTEIDTDYEEYLYEVFGRVATTGEDERHELYTEPDGIWYDFYVFRPEGAGPRRVAVVFQDVTERKETETALRTSEKRLRLATDIANVAVFEWNLETGLVSGNERMNELFGYDEDETIVGPALLEERVHPDDHEWVVDRLEEVFESESSGDYEFEFRATRPDGSERWVLTNGEVFFEGDGEDRRAVRVFGTGIDITERKEIEEKLRESEERQSYLVELNDALRSLTDPVAIQEEACRVLGEHLDVKRAQYGELDLDRAVIDITRDYYRGGQDVDELPSLVGEYHFDDFPAHAEAWLGRRSLIVNDAERDPALSESERTGMAQRGVRATLSTPLVKNGEPAVVMAVTSSVPREWTEADIALLEETVDRTWEAVQRAQAEEKLAAELEAMKQLQEVSTRSIQHDDGDGLYESVLDTGMDLVDAEFGTIQRLDPQARELDMFAYRGFSGEMIAHWDRVGVETSSSCARALQTEERVVVPDVQSCEFIEDGDDLEAFNRAGIRSVQSTPLVSRSGELLGMFSTHWADTHEPSERDLHLLDVISRQVADLMQQRAAYEALEESEKKYRSLFEEIDEGFALCELVRDADGTVSDLQYLELNEAFEELTGVGRTDAEGRLLTEVFPGQDESLFEQCRGVVETGEPERVETYVPANDRWYDVRLFPREGDVIAALYDDITERKRREKHEQFLLELSDQLHTLTTEQEIGEACTRLLAEELGLDRAYFVRFDADAEEALVGPEYHSSTLDPVSGLYPFSAFPEAIQQIGTETPVYHDVANDSTLPEAERQALLELDFGAWIGAPIRTDEEGVDWALYAVYSDSHDWTVAEISLLEEVADRTWTVVERARAEQALTRSNQSLERLNDVSRQLIDADPETISERVAQLVVDVLDVEYAALWRYDARTGDIELDTEHAVPGTDFDAIRPAEVSHGQVWETFVGDELNVENALDIADGDPWPSGLGSRVFAPLGRHGVVCVGSEDSETFDTRLLDLLQMVVSTVKTTWDRADSEQELAQRNEELTRLDRLNTLIRAIDQGLVRASTVDEIDEAVCNQLAGSELFGFAWIGDYDAGTESVEPRAWAGIESHRLETLIDASHSSTPETNPFTATVRSGEMQTVSDIATDSRAADWRKLALEGGARSLVAVPLSYRGSVFGVLVVYGRTPQPDERETEVLAELGQTIAHAITATETATTRQTDTVVELTLRFPEANTPLCQLSRRAECVIEFEGLVSRSDGEPDVFFTVSETSAERVRSVAEQLLVFDTVQTVLERADETLFKARVVEPTIASRLVAGGAVVRSLTVDAGTATAVVDLSSSVEVGALLDDLRTFYPELELLTRRTRQRVPSTQQTISAVIGAELTDRQREVLQTAYRSGFFESPRVNSATDVTELLDISQSTFSYHLREAERKLCEFLFDETTPAESEGTEPNSS